MESCRHQENPADLVSRSATAKELCSTQLWWHGPTWLKSQSQIERQLELEVVEDQQPEQRSEQVALALAKQSEDNFLDRFSTLQRLIRVIVTCIKFAQLCKRKSGIEASQSLTLEELEHARKCIIKMQQRAAFKIEMHALRENRTIPNSSSLKHLNSLLDSEGLLRVGVG